MEVVHKHRFGIPAVPGARLLVVGLLVTLAAALSPASARAATVSLSGVNVNINSVPGESNNLAVSVELLNYRVVESGAGATLTAGLGCLPAGSNQVLCPLAGILAINVAAGDQNDVVTFSGSTAVNFQGGDGNDTLAGGLGADTLTGGAGTDTVTYAARSAAVTADLDGSADDGEAGENDSLGSIENLTGGSGADTLTGDSGSNAINGGGGADKLDGSIGADTIAGGNGNDTLLIRDAFADTASCGSGTDSATADGIDAVSSDCESVFVLIGSGGSVGGGLPGSGGGTAGGGGGAYAAPITISPRAVNRAGVVGIRISCSANASGGCKGTLTLTALRAAKGRTARGSRRSRPTVLGKKRFSLAAGKSKQLRVRISRRARPLISRRKKLKVRASALIVANGQTMRVTQTITVRSSRRARPSRVRSKR